MNISLKSVSFISQNKEKRRYKMKNKNTLLPSTILLLSITNIIYTFIDINKQYYLIVTNTIIIISAILYKNSLKNMKVK